MKRFLCAFLTLAMLVTAVPAMAAASGVTVTLDGQVLTTDAYIGENGRTMVPLTALESVFDVGLSDDGKTAYLALDGVFGVGTSSDGKTVYMDTVWFIEGENRIYFAAATSQTDDVSIDLDMTSWYEMDTACVIRDGVFFLPLRQVFEFIGYTVGWNAQTSTAAITSPAAKNFAFDLLTYMPTGENYMVSPLSLEIALAMAANGASGATQSEMLAALGIDDLDTYNTNIKALIEKYAKNEAVTLSIANSLWLNTSNADGMSFSGSFLDVIKAYYGGTAQSITNSGGADIINGWVSDKTNEKIKDITDDDTVAKAIAILVNAVYFQGDWSKGFDPENTEDGIFRNADGSEGTASFMADTDDYLYYENGDFQFLANPYKDENVKMYIALPKDGSALTQADFDAAVEGMSYREVNLMLPKFKTEYTHGNLVDILKSMGVITAFASDADFYGMFEGETVSPTRISGVIQKTYIDVGEEGTEAAAATEIIMSKSSIADPDLPIDFFCDKPFYYIIRDDESGEILFMGMYCMAE